jgi:hypothetical protein
MYNSKLAVSTVALLLLVAVGTPAFASAPALADPNLALPASAGGPQPKYVKTEVDGHFYHLPEAAKGNLDIARALIAASDGMGMTRITAWVNTISEGDVTRACIGCSTDIFEYNGSGLFEGKQAKLVRIHFDLRIPAARVDVTAADGSRSVAVARDKLAWDESAPGVFKAASTISSVERMIPAYLSPHAALVFAVPVIDKIKLAKTDTGLTTLTFPVALLGTDMQATVDRSGRVIHTEFRYGGKLYSGDYSDFANDKMDYHVMGPHRVVQKVDGKIVTDLTLEYHWVNPYVIFAVPKQLAAK